MNVKIRALRRYSLSLEAIQANAQLVVKRCREVSGLGGNFGFNLESVKYVDGFIERHRASRTLNPDTEAAMIRTFGSFLGECVIHVYGGAWREHEGGWGVYFDDLNAVFPFTKVSKQYKNGHEDSILSFFEMIGLVFLKNG